MISAAVARQFPVASAGVAELEYAPGLGPGGLRPVGVRVPPPAFGAVGAPDHLARRGLDQDDCLLSELARRFGAAPLEPGSHRGRGIRTRPDVERATQQVHPAPLESLRRAGSPPEPGGTEVGGCPAAEERHVRKRPLWAPREE